jgi:hypothetical protein
MTIMQDQNDNSTAMMQDQNDNSSSTAHTASVNTPTEEEVVAAAAAALAAAAVEPPPMVDLTENSSTDEPLEPSGSNEPVTTGNPVSIDEPSNAAGVSAAPEMDTAGTDAPPATSQEEAANPSVHEEEERPRKPKTPLSPSSMVLRKKAVPLEDTTTREEEPPKALLWGTSPTKYQQERIQQRRQRRKARFHRYLCQDTILVHIPMNQTADLGLVLSSARTKRRRLIQENFPWVTSSTGATEDSLAVTNSGSHDDEEDDEDDHPSKKRPRTDDGAENLENGSQKKKKNGSVERKSLPGTLQVPRREDFNNMVDYLEAKYVQGVVVSERTMGGIAHHRRKNQQDQDHSDHESTEGEGSVYSQDSFFDDTDLQRTVAEQVLAQTTTTTLEAQGEQDFFVNVGELEVEENDHARPEMLLPSETDKKAANLVVRKRKKPSAVATSTTPTSSSKTSAAPKKGEAQGAKKKMPEMASKAKSNPEVMKKTVPKNSEIPKRKEGDPTRASPAVAKSKSVPVVVKEEPKVVSSSSGSAKKKSANADLNQKLKRESLKKERQMKALLTKVVDLVHAMAVDNLPRATTKEWVSVAMPANTKPGDSITFTNPHVKGQRLKVKIPASAKPGGTFRVAVPAKQSEEERNENEDHNRFDRFFYEAVDDYSRAYDDWCDAQQVYYIAIKKEYHGHLEKRNKFDEVAKAFPKNLKTPVDKVYLQKILRRARQNRSKRERNARAEQLRLEQLHGGREKEDDDKAENGSDDEAKQSEQPQKKNSASVPASNGKVGGKTLRRFDTVSVLVPQRCSEFPIQPFQASDFSMMS